MQVSALKAEKRQRDQQRKQKISENRKHLANVRVVQKNLVFVVGLPPRLADAEVSYCIYALKLSSNLINSVSFIRRFLRSTNISANMAKYIKL